MGKTYSETITIEVPETPFKVWIWEDGEIEWGDYTAFEEAEIEQTEQREINLVYSESELGNPKVGKCKLTFTQTVTLEIKSV